jgi:hypothetical protein
VYRKKSRYRHDLFVAGDAGSLPGIGRITGNQARALSFEQ